MKKGILIFMTGGSLGVFAGFVIGIFLYPYIFLADIVAEDRAPDDPAKKVVAEGTFIHANPSDPIHYGRGGVRVYQDLLHLDASFEVGPGPKFHVYLAPLEEVTPDTDVPASMYVDLGRLKAFKGSQNFNIPAGLDLTKFKHVVIWCEKFGVLISPAKLAFKG